MKRGFVFRPFYFCFNSNRVLWVWVILLVSSHFVPRSFRTLVISYLFWSFHTNFGRFVPSNNHFVPGHFVPILVSSYLYQMGTKWLHGIQFVPKSFRTQFGHFVPSSDVWIDGAIHFDHFVPRSNGYEMTLSLMCWCIYAYVGVHYVYFDVNSV